MRRERGNNSVLEGDSPAETALIWLIGPAVLLYGAYLLAGFLAGRGDLSLALTILVGTLGSVLGTLACLESISAEEVFEVAEQSGR